MFWTQTPRILGAHLWFFPPNFAHVFCTEITLHSQGSPFCGAFRSSRISTRHFCSAATDSANARLSNGPAVVNRRAALAIKPNPHGDGPRSVSVLPICKVDVRGIPIPGGARGPRTFVNCFTYAERGLSYQAPRATGHWRSRNGCYFEFSFPRNRTQSRRRNGPNHRHRLRNRIAPFVTLPICALNLSDRKPAGHLEKPRGGIAQRQRLEAVARWNELQAHRARANGDFEAAQRFHENAMTCRLRQR
jgi:hypothetical protein